MTSRTELLGEIVGLLAGAEVTALEEVCALLKTADKNRFVGFADMIEWANRTLHHLPDNHLRAIWPKLVTIGGAGLKVKRRNTGEPRILPDDVNYCFAFPEQWLVGAASLKEFLADEELTRIHFSGSQLSVLKEWAATL